MSSGNGTTFGYYVEARNASVLKGSALPVIGKTSIGTEWTRIPMYRTPEGLGVPSGLWCPIANAVTELQSYAAACALMAWAAASDSRGLGMGFGLEFRLVRAKLTYSWSVEEVATGKPISYRDNENAEFPREAPHP